METGVLRKAAKMHLDEAPRSNRHATHTCAPFPRRFPNLQKQQSFPHSTIKTAETSNFSSLERNKMDFVWETNQYLFDTTYLQPTVGQNRKKHRMNSHPIIYCPPSSGVSEVSEVTERASERSGARERSEQGGASSTSERCE